MADLICVMGESGSGKTTSLRNLDPASTLIIDADKKGLSWRGWRARYNAEARNYLKSDEPSVVLKCLRAVDGDADYTHVKTVVVDTLNGLMVGDEYRNRSKPGYDKWADLAWSVWGVLDYALTMRDDLAVVFTAHAQTERDDTGALFTRVKTSGRKLDKLVVESKFPTVLLAKNDGGRFVFESRAPNTTAKAPLGLFETPTVPNDVAAVIEALMAYNNEEGRFNATA